MKLFTILKAKLSWMDKERESELCPLPQRLDLSTFRRVQVFIPHPDDESIGCGGLLALLMEQGSTIQAVLVTDGGGAGGLPATAIQERRAEFIAALKVLGIDNYLLLDLPDGNVQSSKELNLSLHGVLKDFKPDSVVMPSILDLHRDHRVIAKALLEVCKKHSFIQQLIQYEVWCPLPVTHILDITAVAQKKWQAIAQHKTALACGNYLSASEGLARYRALLLGPFGNPIFAEAFVVDSNSSLKSGDEHWLAKTSQELISRLAVNKNKH
jgi:LmbE family N-acetylglucosaminyl deacetylase